jgi:hypothetical protein
VAAGQCPPWHRIVHFAQSWSVDSRRVKSSTQRLFFLGGGRPPGQTGPWCEAPPSDFAVGELAAIVEEGRPTSTSLLDERLDPRRFRVTFFCRRS